MIANDLALFYKDWNSNSKYILVHTSGSTGKPKPVLVEKQKMLMSAKVTCDFLHLRAEQSALLCMPMKYIAGKMMVVRTLERRLRLLYVEPSNHPLAELNEIPDFAAMVPSQVMESLKVESERKKLMQIKQLIIGGGSISHELQEQIGSFPNAVWSTYGMTETLSHVALRRLNGPNSSIYYKPFAQVKVSLNMEGCIVLDVPWAIQTQLITNDLAELQPDGSFRILGRKDNVICSGGIKIQIEEAERLLHPVVNHPFLISSRADAILGEAAVILVQDNDNRVDDDLLIGMCRKVLPKYWAPKNVLHVQSLPLTETGKPARQDAKILVGRNF